MRHIKSFTEERVDWYMKIARIKYAGKTADEIIEIIENGTEGLRFNSEEEKELFKHRWENEQNPSHGPAGR